MSNSKFASSYSYLVLPDEDPRIHVEGHNEYLVYRQSHREMLEVYNLIITKILSHENGIDLATLRKKLIYEYYINKKAVDQVLAFIMSGNAKNIEVESASSKSKNEQVIFRRPRQVLTVDSFCLYVPRSHKRRR